MRLWRWVVYREKSDPARGLAVAKEDIAKLKQEVNERTIRIAALELVAPIGWYPECQKLIDHKGNLCLVVPASMLGADGGWNNPQTNMRMPFGLPGRTFDDLKETTTLPVDERETRTLGEVAIKQTWGKSQGKRNV